MDAPRFEAGTRAALASQGWRLLEAPPGLTLAGLRDAGAPFKGTRYFDHFAAETEEAAFAGGEVAYRPGLMPGSLNRTYDGAASLAAGLQALLPPGAVPMIAPAALYVWLLVEHRRRRGEWLLAQAYAWAADRWRDTHLVVGVFGRERPLLVSPLLEGSGRGVGLAPVVVPAPV